MPNNINNNLGNKDDKFESEELVHIKLYNFISTHSEVHFAISALYLV